MPVRLSTLFIMFWAIVSFSVAAISSEEQQVEANLRVLKNSFVFSEDLKYFFYAGLPDQPAGDLLSNILEFLQGTPKSLIRDILAKNATQKILQTFEMAKPLREFIQTAQAEKYIQYLKGYVLHDETRRFMDEVVRLANGNNQYLLSLCLGESLTFYPVEREGCVLAMHWIGGLDIAHSRELLEHAAELYRLGIIDEVLKLQSHIQELKAEFAGEIARARYIALFWFLNAQSESRNYVEQIYSSELPMHSKRWLFESVFEKGEAEALIRLFEMSQSERFLSARAGSRPELDVS